MGRARTVQKVDRVTERRRGGLKRCKVVKVVFERESLWDVYTQRRRGRDVTPVLFVFSLFVIESSVTLSTFCTVLALPI
jgi:hypothetical protein